MADEDLSPIATTLLVRVHELTTELLRELAVGRVHDFFVAESMIDDAIESLEGAIHNLKVAAKARKESNG